MIDRTFAGLILSTRRAGAVAFPVPARSSPWSPRWSLPASSRSPRCRFRPPPAAFSDRDPPWAGPIARHRPTVASPSSSLPSTTPATRAPTPADGPPRQGRSAGPRRLRPPGLLHGGKARPTGDRRGAPRTQVHPDRQIPHMASSSTPLPNQAQVEMWILRKCALAPPPIGLTGKGPAHRAASAGRVCH